MNITGAFWIRFLQVKKNLEGWQDYAADRGPCTKSDDILCLTKILIHWQLIKRIIISVFCLSLSHRQLNCVSLCSDSLIPKTWWWKSEWMYLAILGQIPGLLPGPEKWKSLPSMTPSFILTTWSTCSNMTLPMTSLTAQSRLRMRIFLSTTRPSASSRSKTLPTSYGMMLVPNLLLSLLSSLLWRRLGPTWRVRSRGS